ncbi:MAG: GntR family transcriptional regulator [Anaerolineae bacterium]|nr:GntR family transcriptional regulator [Anaerolineae bacterium]
MRLDKSLPIPLYYQLAENLREEIESGALKPGAQLPSERELGEELGISRMTVRQAITYLAQKGTLVIKPGVGTFVAEPKFTYDALHLLGFTEEMMVQGRVVSSRVLEQAVVSPPNGVAAKLGLDGNARTIKIVRLRLEQDTPLLLETIHIPATFAPRLEKQDLARNSLYALLESKYDIVLKRACQTFEATTANEYEAHLFDIALHAPMLLSEGVTFSESDVPVEHFKAVYRGDRFKFELASQRNAWVNDLAIAPRISLVLENER